MFLDNVDDCDQYLFFLLKEVTPMSQFGHLILTDQSTVSEICSTWTPALPEPEELERKNPFTGELMKLKIWFPPLSERKPEVGQATFESVVQAFRERAALFSHFPIDSMAHEEFVNEIRPLFRGEEGEGVTVDLVSPDLESKLVPYFAEELGEYADQAVRRERGLSFFVLIDSF